MLKKVLILTALAALLIVPAALAGTVSYPIAAAGTHASVTRFTTTQPGNITITLNYQSPGVADIGMYSTANNGINDDLKGICTSAAAPGFFTETCVNAPASTYVVTIYASHGNLKGTLTIDGQF